MWLSSAWICVLSFAQFLKFKTLVIISCYFISRTFCNSKHNKRTLIQLTPAYHSSCNTYTRSTARLSVLSVSLVQCCPTYGPRAAYAGRMRPVDKFCVAREGQQKKYKNYSQTWAKFKCPVYKLEAVTGSIRMTQLFTHHSSHSVGFRRGTWLWVRGYSRPAVKARVHSLATVSNQTTHQPLSISGSISQDCSYVARIKRNSKYRRRRSDGAAVRIECVENSAL